MPNFYGPPAPGQFGPDPLPGGSYGMMDPMSYDPRYDKKSAGLLAQQAQVAMEEAPQKSGWMDYVKDLAPAIAVGAITGGMGIPAALAYGIGASSNRMSNDRARQDAWQKTRYGQAGELYGAASDRLNTGFNALPQSARPGGRTHTPGEIGKAAFDIFNRPYHQLAPEEQKVVDEYLQTSAVRTAAAFSGRDDLYSGEWRRSDAREGGARAQQEAFELRKELRGIEDEIGMKETAVEYLYDIRDALADGSIGADTPLPEIEQYFTTAAARLNRMVRELQLAGLADQTLTPVSDADLAILMKSIMNPRLSQEKKLAQFDDFIEGKMKEIRQQYNRANRRNRLLGRDQLSAPTGRDDLGINIPEPGALPEFDAEAYLNGETE